MMYPGRQFLSRFYEHFKSGRIKGQSSQILGRWLLVLALLPSLQSAQQIDLVMPFRAGTIVRCTQGPGGSFTHRGFATAQDLDFAIGEGTAVVAAVYSKKTSRPLAWIIIKKKLGMGRVAEAQFAMKPGIQNVLQSHKRLTVKFHALVEGEHYATFGNKEPEIVTHVEKKGKTTRVAQHKVTAKRTESTTVVRKRRG